MLWTITAIYLGTMAFQAFAGPIVAKYIIFPVPEISAQASQTLQEKIAKLVGDNTALGESKVYAEIRYGRTIPQFWVAFLTESAAQTIRSDPSVSILWSGLLNY